jgi:hypothetical protein
LELRGNLQDWKLTEFSDFYVNQSLAGQTIPPLLHRQNKVTLLRLESMVRAQ